MIPRVLQRPTLVLNRNWQPVNVATVARALRRPTGQRVADARPRHPACAGRRVALIHVDPDGLASPLFPTLTFELSVKLEPSQFDGSQGSTYVLSAGRIVAWSLRGGGLPVGTEGIC